MEQQHVSEQIMEALLSELSVYALKSCSQKRASVSNAPKIHPSAAAAAAGAKGGAGAAVGSDESGVESTSSSAGGGGGVDPNIEQERTVAAEMSAAKLERMGYAVGYRLTERLAQHKTWNSLLSQDAAAQTAAQQLEAVKFLCKEVWANVFGKQIDKLQTNHRGVFVLKDLDLKWLSSFPSGTELARVKAIQLLAFPCGIIRGCLADLGIPAVVSCDFLADGTRMSACSFNIKVK